MAATSDILHAPQIEDAVLRVEPSRDFSDNVYIALYKGFIHITGLGRLCLSAVVCFATMLTLRRLFFMKIVTSNHFWAWGRRK